jgi:hypothetical protein
VTETVTKKPKLKCAWCKKRFSAPARGRTPKYCCRSHRQRAYERRRAAESLPMRLLGRDLDEHRTRAGIERAVVGTLRRFGFLPPAPKGAPPIRLVKDGHGTPPSGNDDVPF